VEHDFTQAFHESEIREDIIDFTAGENDKDADDESLEKKKKGPLITYRKLIRASSL
jgi:hypothetical protein